MNVEYLRGLLPSVITIAAQASAAIMVIYDSDECAVELKNDNSPLTSADLAAHNCICSALAKLSDYPILSEESASIPFGKRSQWESYWLVDPLDGTKEFVKRNGDFTVNIALIHQHKPVLGVVYVPVTGVCYYAAKNCGAFKQAVGKTAEPIQVRSASPQHLIVAGSRSHTTPELEHYLRHLPEHTLISIGSSLKFCLVAEGQADIYPRLGLTSEWDTAAAHCVVEQAGGAVIEINGNDLQYNRKDCLLNPYFLVIGNQDHDWSQYAVKT